jgi:hypothetical protein
MFELSSLKSQMVFTVTLTLNVSLGARIHKLLGKPSAVIKELFNMTKHFSVLFGILYVSTFAMAQKADVALVTGESFVNDFKVSFTGTPTTTNIIKTNSHLFLEGTFAVRLLNGRLVSLHLEVPVVGIPANGHSFTTVPTVNFLTETTINTSAVFVTPALRLKVLPSAPISPWASLGGGWARLSSDFATTTNKGALQYGGGLDFKTGLPLLGFRAEVRDFVTGDPDFGFVNVLSETGGSLHRHNVMVGGGIVFRL